MNYLEKYNYWLESTIEDKTAREELLSLKNNKEEINNRFFQDLEFGTGGLRGKLGYGTNNMNFYVIARATQGLANFLLAHYKNPSVVIGYDSRNFSKEFAQKAAQVLGANNIKTYLFKKLVPTPVVSYSVRKLSCSAGIVVTASHNPKEYNGYKVYGEDGGQLNVESAEAIYKEMSSLDYFHSHKEKDLSLLIEQKTVELIYEDIFDSFIKSTLNQSLDKETKRELSIIYTPLHGSGLCFVKEILEKDGFKKVHVVKEQELPDGNFPTASYPNPEIKDALKLGLRDLKQLEYDILIATDPDADRLGVAISTNNGVQILTGNEVGLLLFDWIYKIRKERNTLPKNPLLVKTIVSSNMADIIAKDLNVECVNVLTGFKFIGEQIKLLESKNQVERFLLGFEESCGYLTNCDVRDKDSVNAAMLVAEMANYYKAQNKTLVDAMNCIYQKYGRFISNTVSFTFEGEKGREQINSLMKAFRSEKVDQYFPNILSKYDYLNQVGYYSLKDKKFDVPSSDVIQIILKDSSSITIRPSGTEPKIKFYYFVSPNPLISLDDVILDIISKVKDGSF